MTKPLIKIAITMGEPAGIGPEIISKSVQHTQFNDIQFIIIGDQKLFPTAFIQSLPSNTSFEQIDFNQPVKTGHPNTHYAPQILKTLDIAIDKCLNKQADALVTAPINKDNIHAVQPNFYGHTDYIADYIQKITGKYHKPIMMLSCDELKTVPLTVHIPLKDVPQKITSEMIIQNVQIVHHALKTDYALKNPRVKIAGLNPHAGDNNIIGTEETEILWPAIHSLRDLKIDISDPLSADTMFHAKARKQYDVAICMYHDQALIPVKTLAFDKGVNVTLGLPIIRTSPDHGTATNIAGRNQANPNAMVCAISEAIQLIKNRQITSSS